MIKDARITAVYGRRGSGKSTLVKGLIRGLPKVVVFDPMDEHGRARGWVRAHTMRQVRDLMAKRWRGGFRIAYVASGDFILALHRLTDFLWDAQAPYDSGEDGRKLTLVVEEMNVGFPARQLPAGRDGMMRAILQGRHRGLEIVGITQRPARVSPDFRSNAYSTYLFSLEDYRDLQTIRQQLGPERAAQVRALPDYHALRIRGGQIEQVRVARNGAIV